MLSTVLFFLLALFILVTVHEYGHFQVARWCGVKVLRFSFGFGKTLFAWKDKKGTEYACCLLPLGGYVKMLDENEGEVKASEKHLAFNGKSVWARMSVVAAGPFLNFVLAFVLLWLASVIGVKTLAPMIGKIQMGSIAAQAGLKANQEILSVDGQKVQSWQDFQYFMLKYMGTKASIPIEVKSLSDGHIEPLFLSVDSWRIDNQNPDLLASLGIEPFLPKVEPEIAIVLPDSPAAKAGLLEQDKVTGVNEHSVDDWLFFVKYVQGHPNQTVQLHINRKGIAKDLLLFIKEESKNGKTQGYVGLVAKPASWPAHWLRLQQEKPLPALVLAGKQTVELTGATFILMTRLLTGKLSLGSISGPVGIAQGAGNSAKSGVVQYLLFLALMSISLGVLNLLPIPMLDGGHLLYYALEVIFRRPVSEKIQSAGIYLGMLFLSALMIIAFTNDIYRLVK